MTVYEFLKQAPPDIAALEIGRIILGLLGALGVAKLTPEDALTWGVKCTAGAMTCLQSEFQSKYYQKELSKIIAMEAKAMVRRSKEKEDADGQQDHASAGQSDGDAAV